MNLPLQKNNPHYFKIKKPLKFIFQKIAIFMQLCFKNHGFVKTVIMKSRFITKLGNQKLYTLLIFKKRSYLRHSKQVFEGKGTMPLSNSWASLFTAVLLPSFLCALLFRPAQK